MTDQESPENKRPPIFPPENLPTVYTDGPLNMSHGGGLVRFYLSRLDPSVNSMGDVNAHPIAQVIMTVEGFLAMAAFFNASIETMVSGGAVTKERAEEISKMAYGAFRVGPTEAASSE
jgi:hypothetical protein